MSRWKCYGYHMTNGIVITADKKVTVRDIDGLSDMQAIVGGYIERVGLKDGSSMYLNEEGRIHGLPFNSIASDVLGLGGRADLMLAGVMGDAFIVGPDDGEGNDTHVTDAAKRWVERVKREA